MKTHPHGNGVCLLSQAKWCSWHWAATCYTLTILLPSWVSNTVFHRGIQSSTSKVCKSIRGNIHVNSTYASLSTLGSSRRNKQLQSINQILAQFSLQNCINSATLKGFWAWIACESLILAQTLTMSLQNLHFVFILAITSWTCWCASDHSPAA